MTPRIDETPGATLHVAPKIKENKSPAFNINPLWSHHREESKMEPSSFYEKKMEQVQNPSTYLKREFPCIHPLGSLG